MLNICDIFFAFQIACLAYVVSCVLMEPDYLLEPYYDFLVWLEQYAKWLTKPLGMCEKCLGGQLALWIWLLFNRQEYAVNIVHALLHQALFVSFSILFVTIIKKTIHGSR